MLLSSIGVLLAGFIYVVLNILQTAFVVAGKRVIVSFCHFFVALLWVFIITLIIKHPIEHGIAYAVGSSLGMLCSGYFNNTIIIPIKK